jgi:hypothetical protein
LKKKKKKKIFFQKKLFSSSSFIEMTALDMATKSTLAEHEHLTKCLTEFDREDIGHRIPDMADDLANVKNILVTGGAGFM